MPSFIKGACVGPTEAWCNDLIMNQDYFLAWERQLLKAYYPKRTSRPKEYTKQEVINQRTAINHLRQVREHLH